MERTRFCRQGLIAASAAGSLAMSCETAFAQACPSPVVVNNTECTVPPATVINVTPAGATGLNGSGAAGIINANGITLNLAAGSTATTTTGGLAQAGSAINFNGSTLQTTTTTTATSANHVGLRATGAGSTINAVGSSLTLGPPNGTTAASNMLGATAEAGSMLDLANTSITMLGGVAGLNNIGLRATGAGSRASYSGGTIATRSQASFGVQAINGGQVTLGGGAIVTTTGTGSASIAGSHALFATGTGSQITGDTVTATASGNFTNGARVEAGGVITLTNSGLFTSGTSAADTDPTSAARIMSGGQLQFSGGTLAATGQRGAGFSVQDAGSSATISNSAVSAAGIRANAAFIFNGGRASVDNSSLTSTGSTAVVVQDSGSAIDLTNTTINANTPPAVIGFGLRVTAGASATMAGGSIATTGRDSPGIHAAGATVTATNVIITTSGTDNAIGALADLNGQVTLNGGSVTTSGDAIRVSSFPHALAARNPGAVLTSTGTTLLTTGLIAMGAVADDGGTVILSGNSITTRGDRSIGLFAVTEQVGAQFPANLTATSVTLETFGINAHGVTAQARNDVPVEKATATINSSSVTTHGAGAAGLRAVLGDYGTRPIAGRGEAAVIANSTTVLTEGVSAYGALSRDNPTSVTMNQSSVLATGQFGHGSVADAGGLIIGNNSTITATGASAAAFYAVGMPTAVSTGLFTNTNLLNNSGPTIGVAGSGNVSLTNSFAGGSGEWLRVGTTANFPPLTAAGLPNFGVPDPDAPDTPPPFTLPPPTLPPSTPGLANVTLTHSTVVGAATTLPGSVSNVTLLDNSTWIMTGNSNVTNLINDPSLIQFTPPVGDPTLLSSYKTLTTVNYLGLGGLIGLNTFLGSDPSPSDRLVIDGGNASGSSPLRITNTIGRGDLTRGNGILVVDTINGGTTVPGTFSLAGPVVAGPYEYGLFRSSVDASNPDAWYLRSTIDCSREPFNPACQQPNPPTPSPHFRVETSLYAAVPSMALLYGRTVLDTLHERVGEEEDQRRRPDPEGGKLGWGRIIGVNGHQSGDTIGVLGSGPSYNYTFLGLQAGTDVYRHDGPDGSRDQAGVYFAIGGDQGRVTHFDGSRGDSNFNAYTLGGYWTHFGPNGWYTDAIVQGTAYDINSSANRFLPALRTGGRGVAASVEGGYPFKFAGGYFIEPQAQLVYQNVDIFDASDIAAQIHFSDVNSLAARIGARFGRTWAIENTPQTITAWIRPNLWNEFLGNPITAFSSETGFVPFHADLRGLWGEINVGVSGQVTSSTTLYANASYSSRFDGGGFAYTGKAGVRVMW
jgi:outer membrane autotransporter protein